MGDPSRGTYKFNFTALHSLPASFRNPNLTQSVHTGARRTCWHDPSNAEAHAASCVHVCGMTKDPRVLRPHDGGIAISVLKPRGAAACACAALCAARPRRGRGTRGEVSQACRCACQLRRRLSPCSSLCATPPATCPEVAPRQVAGWVAGRQAQRPTRAAVPIARRRSERTHLPNKDSTTVDGCARL